MQGVAWASIFLASDGRQITVTDMSGHVGKSSTLPVNVLDDCVHQGVERVMAGTFWDSSPPRGNAADETVTGAGSHHNATVVSLADWVSS